MKEKFINDLKDELVSYTENEGQLKDLISKEQTIMLSEDKHRDFGIVFEKNQNCWTDDYIKEMSYHLTPYENKIDKKLAEHLIEVKKYIESKKTTPTQTVGKELSIPEKNDDSVENDFEQKNKVRRVENSLKVKSTSQVNLDSYKPSDKLANLLGSNDVRGIHNYLMLILNNRRLDLEFVIKEIHYVWQNRESVFQEEEDSAFIQPIDKNEKNWNMNYFTSQQVYLNRNFSLVRLLHLLNVREFLMKKGDPNFKQIIKTENPQKVQENAEQPVQYSEQHTTQSSGAKNNHYQQTQGGNHSSQSEQGSMNPFFKIVALVGGAVFALVATLFAKRK